MRRRHFAALQPVCLLCRGQGVETPLELNSVWLEDGEHVIEGVLQCRDAACRREYPIVDGIPILVRDVRAYVQTHLMAIQQRRSLAAPLESLLGDCCGPDSPFNTQRQHLSTYGASHWGDLWQHPEEDPLTAGEAEAAASLLDLSAACRRLAGELPAGPRLDIGCALGRTSFELAASTEASAEADDLVLGIDLHFAMLRPAARLLRGEGITLPCRRTGVVYGPRSCHLAAEHLQRGAERLDFWACDGLDLPFGEETFAAIGALNVLDCLASPIDGLRQMGRALHPAGRLWMCSPYDWSSGATPFEGWLGGHSDRGLDGGLSERRLRALLAEPSLGLGLEIASYGADLPWRLRLHDRSTMDYVVDLLILAKATGDDAAQPVTR